MIFELGLQHLIHHCIPKTIKEKEEKKRTKRNVSI